jgi:hypothetical protein
MKLDQEKVVPVPKQVEMMPEKKVAKISIDLKPNNSIVTKKIGPGPVRGK